jgi:two-component system NarL family sensor kinase
VIACSRLKKLVEGTAGLRYHASVPLWAQEKKIGMLNVVSADWRKLSADDLRLLHTIGDLLGIAVERARLFERSVQLGAVEERNRLARELHDTLGQGLAAMLMQLEAIDALLEGGQVQRGRQAVGQTLEMARQALEEVRRSVLDLRAAPLEGRSLGEALEKLAREVASREGLKVRLRVTGGSKPLPMRLEAGLYRMAQEALNNAVRHARAKKVQVELVAGPGQVKLSVADDGQGFDPERLPQDRYGLVGLGERARLLEGRLKIESRPGKGTRLEVVVPLEAGHGR